MNMKKMKFWGFYAGFSCMGNEMSLIHIQLYKTLIWCNIIIYQFLIEIFLYKCVGVILLYLQMNAIIEVFIEVILVTTKFIYWYLLEKKSIGYMQTHYE